MGHRVVFAFKRVTVSVTPDAYKIVEWYIDPMFDFKGDRLVYFVEFARALGEWTRLNPDDPIVNECVFVDEVKRRCGNENNEYYRVVAYDGVQEYYSNPEPTLGVWNTHDWRIARDVVRKEYLRLRRYIGTFGWLLKRKNEGPRCECNDWDTEEPVNSRCDKCYGTGFKGGYYDALPFYLDQTGSTSIKDVKIPFGTVNDKTSGIRAVAYPRLDTYDLWIDGDKNKRYIFRKIQEIANLRGKPLVYAVDMREVPASGVEYEVPLYQTIEDIYGDCSKTVVDECGKVIEVSSSSSSVCDIKKDGWRKGITYEEFGNESCDE